MRFLLETTIFGCYVSFREGTLICNKRLENMRLCGDCSDTPLKTNG